MDNYRARISGMLGDRPLPSVKSLEASRPPAAVLVGIINDVNDKEPRVLLTRRAEHLSSHAGQIAFPGGHWEKEDSTLAATALREAHEEIGLDPVHVELSGALAVHHTGYGQSILPLIGFVNMAAILSPSEDEVAEIFSVPLQFLMTPENYESRERSWNGRLWRYQAIVWQDYEIWGATANILQSFYQEVFSPEKERVKERS